MLPYLHGCVHSWAWPIFHTQTAASKITCTAHFTANSITLALRCFRCSCRLQRSAPQNNTAHYGGNNWQVADNTAPGAGIHVLAAYIRVQELEIASHKSRYKAACHGVTYYQWVVKRHAKKIARLQGEQQVGA
jgi:hypothetical protein